MTLRLAPLVEHVLAIEVDEGMLRSLMPKVPSNVTLVQADVLKFDLDKLRPYLPLRVAGNLPYNISSPILFRLIEAHRRLGRLTDATLMVQREVADRIVAVPGTKDYGVLSILLQLHADIRRVLTLPPGAFRPVPKVQSAVVRLVFRPPAVDVGDEEAFTAMVRSVFTQRRKTLANALKPYAESRGGSAAGALHAAGIEPTRRPETLTLEELALLARSFRSG